MIDPEVIKQIKNAVCAIGYFTEEPRAVFRQVQENGGQVHFGRLPKQIIGTGFLVSDTVVLSNRHVIEVLRKTGTPINWWFLSFIVPTDEGWSERSFWVKKAVMTSWKRLDFALIGFNIGEDKERAEGLASVRCGALSSISVGRPIALCGYLHGDDLLSISEVGVYRFGPVFHQGFISALAPYDAIKSQQVVSFLTDVGSGFGFSGSPVFLPDDGSVIGLHFAGVEGLYGIALPVDEKRVAGWLTVFEEASAEAPVLVTSTNAGDVEFVDVLPPDLFRSIKEAPNKEEAVRLLMDYDSTLDEPAALAFVQWLWNTN